MSESSWGIAGALSHQTDNMDLIHSSTLLDIGSGKWTYAVQYS